MTQLPISVAKSGGDLELPFVTPQNGTHDSCLTVIAGSLVVAFVSASRLVCGFKVEVCAKMLSRNGS